MNRLSVFADRVRERVASRYYQATARPPPVPQVTAVVPRPLQLRRNHTESRRLQGLFKKPSDNEGYVDLEKVTADTTWRQRLSHWLINDGARKVFIAVWLLLHMLVFALGFVNYQMSDNLTGARRTFGITYPIARASALVLYVDVAFLLLPVCRNFITLVRRTPLNSIIPFDANITFHKAIGWSILFFSIVHIAAHMVNFARIGGGSSRMSVVQGFAMANFATGPGITGWIMLAALLVMVWFAVEKRRRKHFERFWYSHHLFIVFFVCWQLHGMFCMIPPDRPPYCSSNTIGVFWKYFIVSGLLFVLERVMREVRSRHRTYISKVIQHPGGVVEVQIKKEHITTRAGQYIFINCPDVSYWQWHPFTLTSAPEEDYISVNFKMVGDWTNEFGKALGVSKMASSNGKAVAADNGQSDNDSAKVILPRIMVDGPFGSASEDYHKFEVVMLCAAGIGVTPFASILKSIWYRLNDKSGVASGRKKTRLRKVYFIHICRDTESVSWFRSLLGAIEAQDTNNSIEIMTYVTQKLKADDLTNIQVCDVGSEKDAITGLRAPTHFGRPNWDSIFSRVKDRHPDTEVGVLFCGPKALGSQLHSNCNKHSEAREDGTNFVWGKENF